MKRVFRFQGEGKVNDIGLRGWPVLSAESSSGCPAVIWARMVPMPVATRSVPETA